MDIILNQDSWCVHSSFPNKIKTCLKFKSMKANKASSQFWLSGDFQPGKQEVPRSWRGCSRLVWCHVSGLLLTRTFSHSQKIILTRSCSQDHSDRVIHTTLFSLDHSHKITLTQSFSQDPVLILMCHANSTIQGQAISVLVRAHLSTGDSSYLEAATRWLS